MTWVEKYPGRLERELEEFADAGLEFRLDQARYAEAGQVILSGAFEVDGREIELEVVYPDLFPYIRPEVFAPGLRLGRHQNPFLGNLCLLEPTTRAWDPSQTGAWLVTERVPYLLSLLEQGGDALRDAEVPQGEPASVYYASPNGTAVFVPAEVLAIGAEHASGSGRLRFKAEEPPMLRIRALVGELAIRGPKGKMRSIARVPEALADRFPGQHLAFRWVRLAAPPTAPDPEGVLAQAEATGLGFGSPQWHRVEGGQLSIYAVVFPEEVEQGVWEDAWVFVVRIRPDGDVEQLYFARAERLTHRDLSARTPHLIQLHDRCVALVGVGALGAALALELAKVGVGELRVLDDDVAEAATGSRWPAGVSAVGHAKVDYLRSRIEFDYPFVDVTAVRHRLGSSAVEARRRGRPELELLEELIDGADLLIDASAEIGIQQLLADACEERGLPQLYVSATEGALGGIVARLEAGGEACWYCLQTALDDTTIPPPAADPSSTVQPRGCSSRTFTGAGFDLLPIVAQAARVAVARLLAAPRAAQTACAYVCSLPDDGLGAPTWSEHAIARHQRCPRCVAAAA